jgi:hypothetical protein
MRGLELVMSFGQADQINPDHRRKIKAFYLMFTCSVAFVRFYVLTAVNMKVTVIVACDVMYCNRNLLMFQRNLVHAALD